MDDDSKEAEKKQKEEQKKIDNAVPLTIEEIEERNEFLNDNAFKDWSRREFQQFIKANEKYGRHDLANIAAEINTKTLAQVYII